MSFTLPRFAAPLSALIVGMAAATTVHSQDEAAPTDAASAYQALFDASRDNKRGLTLYVDGATVNGYVVRMIGRDAVELRSQQHDRIVVKLDRIDAIAQ